MVGPAAARYEQRLHLPELARYDAIGTRTESVVFDPSYDEAATVVWASGLVALSGIPGSAYEQATLLYLLSLEGEAGQACPATCTIGLARALRRAADPDVAERFLPPLIDPDHARADRGAQFLTEVQGGSDVGANVCRAEPSPDGATYRITGEKWFCSVADADQFFLTARVAGGPDGTRGLGSFVVPRMIDGAPNGFSLRRLKDKLGTRGLASGEIDFDGAVAWPIGPVEHGFRTAVGIVLNTSRWMTALGDAGMMRRAVLEAVSYAHHREAFGRPVEAFPAVRRTLADMTATAAGALHLAFALTGLEDVVDAGTADDADVVYHRFLVNVTKYVLSVQATDVVHSAIEILGGNGTIEEFSVLPRLYRDAIVYESWEGTHNVLVNQVLNDLRRLPIVEEVARTVGRLSRPGHGIGRGPDGADPSSRRPSTPCAAASRRPGLRRLALPPGDRPARHPGRGRLPHRGGGGGVRRPPPRRPGRRTNATGRSGRRWPLVERVGRPSSTRSPRPPARPPPVGDPGTATRVGGRAAGVGSPDRAQAGTSASSPTSAMSSREALMRNPADRAAMARNTAPMAKPTV